MGRQGFVVGLNYGGFGRFPDGRVSLMFDEGSVLPDLKSSAIGSYLSMYPNVPLSFTSFAAATSPAIAAR